MCYDKHINIMAGYKDKKYFMEQLEKAMKNIDEKERNHAKQLEEKIYRFKSYNTNATYLYIKAYNKYHMWLKYYQNDPDFCMFDYENLVENLKLYVDEELDLVLNDENIENVNMEDFAKFLIEIFEGNDTYWFVEEPSNYEIQRTIVI